jgi:hypothetical protein
MDITDPATDRRQPRVVANSPGVTVKADRFSEKTSGKKAGVAAVT